MGVSLVFHLHVNSYLCLCLLAAIGLAVKFLYQHSIAIKVNSQVKYGQRKHPSAPGDSEWCLRQNRVPRIFRAWEEAAAKDSRIML